MKKFAIFLVLGLAPILLEAQNPNGNYNPFVDDASISPSPLLSTEIGGKGELSFSIGNSGTDPLKVYSNQQLILTITISHGVPDLDAPLLAVSGSFADLFSWSYNNGTYSAVQASEIPAGSSGTINIAFEVARNSVSPGSNGFNVNITPSPYQTTSNVQHDDAVSSYTYTEEATTINNMEAPAFSIFPNPSEGEIIIDFDGEQGTYMLEIVAANGSIVKQERINMKGDPVSLQLKDLNPGLYHISLSKGEHKFQENLIITE